nr:hypothetical protein [uncultured Capnocytophaga sp.]
MKNNLFLTISLLIAFSCCAQNSIRRVDDNYCRIEIPSENGNFDCKEDGTKSCNRYYVLEETFFKDKIKLFIAEDNDYFGAKACPLNANLKEELLKLGKKRAKIQFNDQFVILDTTHIETIQKCVPMQIKYQKRKNKTLLKLDLTNFSHSPVGNYEYYIYEYYIYLEYKNNKLSLSKIEEYLFLN